MNSENYEKLENAVIDKVAEVAPVPKRSIVKEVVTETLNEMITKEQIYLVTNEEENMLKEFRRFRLHCKSGAMFRWQTTPIQVGEVIITSDSGLVIDPRNESK